MHSRLVAFAFLAAFAAAESGVCSTGAVLRVQPGPDALNRAAEDLRRILASHSAPCAGGDIIVSLEPGVYGPLSLGPEHAAAQGSRVVWRSRVPGAAVVSGALPITGWQQATFNGAPAYVASLPAGSPAVVRQLWVAGTRASRVVVENISGTFGGGLTLWSMASGTAGFIAGSLPAGFGTDAGAVNAVELTWPIVLKNWIAPRCTLASVDVTSRNITLTFPCSKLLLGEGALQAPVTAEAFPGMPLSPAEFWHDVSNGKVYYSLAPGQTPSDLETTAFTSAAETVLVANSTSGHAWQGVTFQYTTWMQPNSADGYVDAQAAVYSCTNASITPGCQGATAEPPGSVRITNSSNLSFTGCTFMHFGTPYAVSIDQGSKNCRLIGNNASDLSGGWLKLGSINTEYSADPSGARWDGYHLVSDNTAAGMAIEFGGACGVFGGFLVSSVLDHNTISDAGYTGVSIGWGWGASPVLPGVGGNSVTNNRIFNVMSKLRDGGGIYVNGFTNQLLHGNSTVQGNWVDSDEAVFAVFYLDNGASWWNFTNNVATSSPLAWAFFMQGCCNLPSWNSTVDTFWWSGDLAPVNNCPTFGCVVDDSTVVQVPAGGPWPVGAQAVMDAAGARPQQVAAAASGRWDAPEACNPSGCP